MYVLNSGWELKCTLKCLGIFPKTQGEGIGFRIWVKTASSATVNMCLFYWTCVVWCGSVKCPFSVCLVISLFSCLAVNNCIGNMLDFPEVLHAARSFLNQSDCRTFQTSILKKQAILNRYLDIIEGLDVLGTNELIKCSCLVMVNSGMPPTLSWLIKFEDPWNSNNSRKVLVAKLFFAYGYIYIGVTYQCSFFIKVMPKYAKVNALMLKCFKMIFQRLEVWRCFFSYDYASIEAINWFSFMKWVVSTAPRHA